MRYQGTITTIVLAGVCATAALIGCAGTKSSESAEADTITRHVGAYPPPPAMAEKPRVGVPPFKVQASGANEQLNEIAADQMTTLATLSGRFDVIERAQLNQLIDEQNLEGVVKAGELARPGQVRGVDYLILGKVTNLRVKAEKSRHGMNLGQVGLPLGGAAGAFDFKDTRSKITTECGVDIRMVDPTTGRVAAAHFGEFKRTDSIGALGVSILGFRSESEADLQLSDDDKGKVLRLAFDEALRKMLPQIDQALMARGSGRSAPAAAAAPSGGAAPVNSAVAPAGEKKFCAQCGKQVASGAKFCAACGAKSP